jgi:multiple sugar transport system permease protein
MESAVADGARPWQRFTRIVLPSVAPAAAIAVTYRALDALRMFEAPYVAAGPGSEVRPPQTWIFDTSLTEFEFGLGATMSVVFLLLTALFGVILVRSLRVRRVV